MNSYWFYFKLFLKNLLVIQRSLVVYVSRTLLEKCPYSKFFWSVFFRIWTEYKEILRISPYSFQIRENVGQKNSRYGHCLHSSVVFDLSVIVTVNCKPDISLRKRKGGILPFPPALEPLLYYSWKSSGIIMKLFPRALNFLKNHFEIKLSCRLI